MWVLVVAMFSFGNTQPVLEKHDFYSKKACEQAKTIALKLGRVSDSIVVLDAQCIYDDSEEDSPHQNALFFIEQSKDKKGQ